MRLPPSCCAFRTYGTIGSSSATPETCGPSVREGGTAARLTSNPGLELFGKFSPDGRFIAFTGQYGGDEQVYVIPSGGGAPRQLTFYPAPGPLAERWGYDNQVYGWTPDGTAVLFRSGRDGYMLTDSKLYTVPMNGGAATALPMPVVGRRSFFARRQEDRILASMARLSQREALSGRLGERPVYF